MAKHVKALFISDVHLGSRESKAGELATVLGEYLPETLYIVGDFIDGWLLAKKNYWPSSHVKLINKILWLISEGTKVVYVTGNHDEFLRSYKKLDFGKLVVVDEIVVEGHLIIHGDRFDSVMHASRTLALAGTFFADMIKIVSDWFGAVQRSLKIPASKRSKNFRKKLFDGYVSTYQALAGYEKALAQYAEEKECHTVICGHMHKEADLKVGNIRYLNCGDWIVNHSYLVWDANGITVHNKNDDGKSGAEKIHKRSNSGL
jgi:UDP-2,3-diacylglucosamine pyrophosphatase LpxH